MKDASDEDEEEVEKADVPKMRKFHQVLKDLLCATTTLTLCWPSMPTQPTCMSICDGVVA